MYDCLYYNIDRLITAFVNTLSIVRHVDVLIYIFYVYLDKSMYLLINIPSLLIVWLSYMIMKEQSHDEVWLRLCKCYCWCNFMVKCYHGQTWVGKIGDD
jgi:hypothetical protein